LIQTVFLYFFELFGIKINKNQDADSKIQKKMLLKLLDLTISEDDVKSKV
jgi:hypothetical protein